MNDEIPNMHCKPDGEVNRIKPSKDSRPASCSAVLRRVLERFEKKHGHDAEIVLYADSSFVIQDLYGNSMEGDNLFEFLAPNGNADRSEP